MNWTPGHPQAGLHCGDLGKRVADLETKLAALMKVIEVGPTAVNIKSSVITIKAGSQLKLDGPMIQLNGGSKPIARMGDQVVAPVPGAPGTITNGAPAILG